MTRDQMIAGLRNGLGRTVTDQARRDDIAAQIQADGETIARMEAELDAGRKAAHDSFEQHRRQAARVAELEAALQPFAAFAKFHDGSDAENHVSAFYRASDSGAITVEHLRRARAALRQADDKP